MNAVKLETSLFVGFAIFCSVTFQGIAASGQETDEPVVVVEEGEIVADEGSSGLLLDSLQEDVEEAITDEKAPVENVTDEAVVDETMTMTDEAGNRRSGNRRS